ncbi:MAG: [Fe-Fe] hydrogenase large subunit C-terminal domain-containing protein [Bacteroidales bacterium]|nr:[Fe-Fe] hydrogenase large subunit C-terminal domain-containing protein [Bacteroidales bacterium]
MGHANRNKLVFTVKDKCRVCYTCVRECPVKTIKIINGQAEVLSERCIGCGNCVNVCSQKAKVYFDSKQLVTHMLTNEKKVIAVLAPSFPADFTDIKDYKVLIGMIKHLGFYKVMDVAFGADLVASKYKEIIEPNNGKSYISSDCPAIVFYIEHFHPELVSNLAPIASPMVAIARVARKKYGNDIKVVFIGPCVAKKAESNEIDEALTFSELKELFVNAGIDDKSVIPSEFDPPLSGKGAIFPVSRGLLQTVNKTDDIIGGEVIVASGKNNFKEAIKEFENNEIANSHLELLCCNGCIMGPGMSEKNKLFFKRSQISKYVNTKLQNLDRIQWEKDLNEFSKINLKQTFSNLDRRLEIPDTIEIENALLKLGKVKPSDHLNCGACGYDTCIEHAIAVIHGSAEDEMCLPYSIEKLHNSINDLNLSNEKLASARQALKQSEKLAHMGQLSAGIAHELNNPLGVITMYSNLVMEELKKDDPLLKDLELIVEQSARCKKIVGGLLNFARKNQVRINEAHILDFAKRSLESVVIPENIKANIVSDLLDPFVMIDTDQMMQVFTNLEKNAIEAMPDGGELIIKISGNENFFEVQFSDTGYGISEENMEKLFTPFFTTKESGKGTGLGLPLVYGIIKMHNGKIDVKSNNDIQKGKTGTTFILTIPRIN